MGRDLEDNLNEEYIAPREDDPLTGPPETSTSNCYDPQLDAKNEVERATTLEDVKSLGWVGAMRKAFGIRFLLMQFFGQLMLRGFNQNLSMTAAPYIWAQLNASAVLVTLFGAIQVVPFACKFLIGITFDLLPVNGYHYFPWMLVASVLGTSSYLCCYFLPDGMFNAYSLAIMLLFCRIQDATVDVAINAHMSKHNKRNPALGPTLSMFFVGGLIFMECAAVGAYGLMTIGGMKDPRVVYLLCAGIGSAVIPLICLNFLGERQVTREESAEVRSRLWEDMELVYLGFIVCICGIILCTLNLYLDTASGRLATALVIVAISLVALNAIMGPEVAKPTTYELISIMCVPNIDAAKFYFFTDSSKMYAAGPHFSPFFFTTILSWFGMAGVAVGIFMFLRYVYVWKFRQILTLAAIMITLAHLPDLMILSRANIAMGIPDTACVLGFAGLGNLFTCWPGMMTSIMIYKCAPAGMEATVVGILASYANFGAIVSDCTGAYLLEKAGVNPRGLPHEDAQFDELWHAVVIAMVLSLLPLLLLPYLMPNAYLTDDFLVTNATSPTAGSWLNRWRGKSDVMESPYW